jgi:hypothetical protein
MAQTAQVKNGQKVHMHKTRITNGIVTRVNSSEGGFREESPEPHSVEMTFRLCDYRHVTESGFGAKRDLRGRRILPKCHVVVEVNGLKEITAWAFYVDGRHLIDMKKAAPSTATTTPMAVARSAMPKPKPYTHITDEEVERLVGSVVGNTGTHHFRYIFKQKQKSAWRA